MMTTDSGGPGPDFGAGTSFTDVIDNTINSAQKAFSSYNAQANAPVPANTIAAIGHNITTPLALIGAGLLLLWWFKG